MLLCADERVGGSTLHESLGDLLATEVGCGRYVVGACGVLGRRIGGARCGPVDAATGHCGCAWLSAPGTGNFPLNGAVADMDANCGQRLADGLLEKIKNSISLQVSSMGQGRAILFVDDPAFRGYWNGTNKLFFNALFFGSNISAPNFEGEEK